MRGKAASCIREMEKDINFLEEIWGNNRFLGLINMFKWLGETFPHAKPLPNMANLCAYVDAETIYSTSTLREWMLKHPSTILTKVLLWSSRVDALFSELCEGLMPFEGVREALELAAECGRIAVISSSAKEELEKDWTIGGLMPFVDILMSCENGSKTEQLETVMACYGENIQTLVVGNMDSNSVVAHEAGICFYPILSGGQAQSWQRFKDEILPAFLAGHYCSGQETRE